MVARKRDDGSVEVGFTFEAMETKSLIETISRLAANVPAEAVEGLVDEYQRSETIAPIFDPTGWMRVQRNYANLLKLAQGFLAFRRVIAEVSTR